MTLWEKENGRRQIITLRDVRVGDGGHNIHYHLEIAALEEDFLQNGLSGRRKVICYVDHHTLSNAVDMSRGVTSDVTFVS